MGAYVGDMGNHVIRVTHPLLEPKRFRCPVRHALLDNSANPGRTITESLDLLVFNKDGVGPKPIPASHGTVNKFAVAHAAEIRLRVGRQRRLGPML